MTERRGLLQTGSLARSSDEIRRVSPQRSPGISREEACMMQSDAV